MTDRALSLTRLLRPRSVAIVGVSPEPTSIGGAVLANLERFAYGGAIHLVSRSRDEVNGRPCVATIADLPADIDCAVLAVPGAQMRDALASCVERRVGGAVVFASGFAETGDAGREAQDSLARIAIEGGLAVNGPNCLGFTNYIDGVALSFEPIAPLPVGAKPSIGVVAQSGAMGSSLRAALLAKGHAPSYVVSTGNEAVIGAEDFLAALIADEATRVIALFVEQLRRPLYFLELARRARDMRKPIVLMHPGRSARARDSARTHTGALSGNHEVMSSFVRHAGVILVETTEELIDVATLLARFPEPPTQGAAVMTNSGAFKGFALDFCEGLDLPLPDLAEATVARLGTILPSFASIENPLDLTAQGIKEPGIFGASAAALLDDPAIGSVVVSIVPGSPAQAMAKLHSLMPVIGAPSKPVALATMTDDAPLPDAFLQGLRDKAVPFFRSPERALRAMAHVTAYGRALAGERGSITNAPLAAGALPGARVLSEYRSKEYLAALGLPIPAGALATDLDAACAAAARLSYPVALKAQAAALAHKSDAGGVMLGLADENALRAAWQRLQENVTRARPGLALDGILVERMAKPGGLEMVVGARRDPQWGPVLMVGLGGVWIEALADVRLLPPDLDEAGIAAEIGKLRAATLLAGARGTAPRDVAALARTVAMLGRLMEARPEIVEIDINPLLVYGAGDGVLALDALIVAD